MHSKHSYLCLTQQGISQSLPTSKGKQEELFQERESRKENREKGGGKLDCRQHNVKTLRLLLLILGEREREIWKSHFLSCPGLTRGALLGRMGLDGNKTNDLSLPANITPHPYTTQLSRVYETFVIR